MHHITYRDGTPLTPLLPGPPANLTASAVSSSQINLAWNAATPQPGTSIASYTVYQNVGSNWNAIGTVTTLTFSVTGLSANTAYSFYVVANSSDGLTSNPSNQASATTQAISTQPFPRFGVQVMSGAQIPDSAHENKLAQYPWIMLGHNYFGMPAGRPRSLIVNNLKGQTLTGKNAVKPLVGQYCNLNESFPTGQNPGFPQWAAQMDASNWWLYNIGTSGTKAQSSFNAAMNLCDMAHTASTNKAQYGGAGPTLWPYEWGATFCYHLFIVGDIDSTMNAPNMDFLYVDNNAPRAVGPSADWRRIGASESGTNANVVAATSLGKQDWGTVLRSLSSNTLHASANTEYCFSTLGLGVDGSNIFGQFDWPMQQFVWGSPISNFAEIRFGGFSGAMQWYKLLQSSARNGMSTPTAPFRSLALDEAPLRLALTMCLMDDGYLIAAFGDGNSQDVIDPNADAQYPVCDEFWGGQLNLGGYLGQPLNTAQGAVQSAAWSNGVWRRDFDNGIVLVNSSTNASPTVSLGGTFYRLRSANGQSVNNAAAVSNISVPGSDGVILMRNPT